MKEEGNKVKNKLIHLNNHLFAQLERLSDEGLTPEELAREIDRSKAISMIAMSIVKNGELALNAKKALSENEIPKLPVLLEE